MQKVIILLLVAIAMQLNCGTIAAELNTLKTTVGDFPTQEKDKRHV